MLTLNSLYVCLIILVNGLVLLSFVSLQNPQIVGNFSTMERFSVKYAGAAIMYMVSKKLKKRHNITDERAALYDAAQTWTAALDGKDFLGTVFSPE